ncbi:aspartate-alanine antiporter [Vibrio splendidus]
MSFIIEQLRDYPFIALFLSLGLGYLIGKIKIGKFELGGIAGSLLVAVALGQIGGIAISNEVKSIFFALFIFMVGYNGGPQFFSSFRLSSLTRLFASFMMTFVGLITVVLLSKWAGLDKGLAAGLAAGGLTQSAIIGTAGNAIDQLNLAPDVTSTLKTNVAVGYSITYIFGSLGPILMMSLIPMVMGWNITKEAKKLAEKMGAGSKQLNEGEFSALSRVSSRAYQVTANSMFVGKSVVELEEAFDADLTIEAIYRSHQDTESTLDLAKNPILAAGDKVYLTGLTQAFPKVTSLGIELGEFSEESNVVQTQQKVVLTNKKLAGITLRKLHDETNARIRRGVYITQLSRMGHDISTLPETELHIGDEITLVGQKEDIAKVIKKIGYNSPLPSVTDFVTMSFGMVLGYLIGEIGFTIGGSHIALGSGLGCLVSGLLVGYLRMRTPRLGSVNHGAANFMQTFGLAVFVAVVGINAGAPALTAIKENGITLLLLGVLVTLIPQVLTFLFNYYVLKIKNPVEALAVIAGSRSANPAFASLLEKTQNSTPVPSFTMTYAVANIFLTLWGPIIINLITKIS